MCEYSLPHQTTAYQTLWCGILIVPDDNVYVMVAVVVLSFSSHLICVVCLINWWVEGGGREGDPRIPFDLVAQNYICSVSVSPQRVLLRRFSMCFIMDMLCVCISLFFSVNVVVVVDCSLVVVEPELCLYSSPMPLLTPHALSLPLPPPTPSFSQPILPHHPT